MSPPANVCEFKISTQRILHFRAHGPDHVYFNLKNLPNALQFPLAVFQGLDREGHEKSVCYVAKPRSRFVDENTSLTVDSSSVFVVFITSTLEVFDWRFEKADERDDKFPVGYAQRFGSLVWRK